MIYEPSDDSYLLLSCVDVKRGEKVLEIGTGSGLIALHCAKVADVTATDINPHAVAMTKENAQYNGLKLEVVRSDLFEAIKAKFDVIIFNPPYLLEGDEERVGDGENWLSRAWEGGESGEEVVLRFLFQAKDFLRPDGRIYLLLSAANEKALDVVSKSYKSKKLDEKKLFFETLMTFELTL
jgi:release factor glutamine methyltransferase